MDQKVTIYYMYYKWSCVFIFQSFSYCLKRMNRLFSPVLNVLQMKMGGGGAPKNKNESTLSLSFKQNESTYLYHLITTIYMYYIFLTSSHTNAQLCLIAHPPFHDLLSLFLLSHKLVCAFYENYFSLL